jgi:hypothetical protein
MNKKTSVLIFLLMFMQLNHVNAFDETAEERERKRFEETTIASQAWCEKGYNRDIGALNNARGWEQAPGI